MQVAPMEAKLWSNGPKKEDAIKEALFLLSY